MGEKELLEKGSQAVTLQILQIKFSEIINHLNSDILVTNEFSDCGSFITLCYDSNATLKIYVEKKNFMLSF